MDQLRFEDRNKAAISMFEVAHGDKLKQVFEGFGGASSISTLRIHGFACAECGTGAITFPILRFYNYSPKAKCYDCQGTKTKEIKDLSDICPICSRDVLTAEDNKCNNGACEDVKVRERELTA